MADQRQALDTAISEKKANFAKRKEAAREALEKAAKEAQWRLSTLKSEKIAEMDKVIAEKLAAAEKKIKNLKWNFDQEFKAQLTALFPDIDYSTKDKVLWRAKSKKQEFFADIWKLEQELADGLAATRAALVKELQAEVYALNKALWQLLDKNLTSK